MLKEGGKGRGEKLGKKQKHAQREKDREIKGERKR